MKRSFVLICVLAATGVLGMLAVASTSRARAQENAGPAAAPAIPKGTLSPESLEFCSVPTLKRVYFGYEQSELSPEGKAALNELASRLPRGTQSVVELRGYTDGAESAQRRAGLSTLRSQEIATYLVAGGIPSDSVLVVTTEEMGDERGSANPEHRRVDIRVFDNCPGLVR